MNQRDGGIGYLKIRVTEAGQALPVEGAKVVVSEYGDNGGDAVLYTLETNNGGLTRTMALAAPPAGESLQPGAARPYAVYNVSVTYPGYRPVEGIGIPVFDRIVSVQPIDLFPLGAEEGGTVMIYETPDTENLQPGGLRREDIGKDNGMITRQTDDREDDER